MELLTTYYDLRDNLKVWENKYIFKAPFTGKVEFLNFWVDNQFIQSGEEVFSIIPPQNITVGQMLLPASGAGKVKNGSNVIIKLNNFPYTEFGSINGTVASISLITKEQKAQESSIDSYLITVDLPQGLKTNYGEVPIMCKLKDTAKVNEVITNIADITKFTDGDKNTIRDRDSEEDNVKLPEDNQLPSYKDEETGDYVPGQQDDDDFEKVIIKPFDLALRKFITKVNNTEVNTRIPQVKYDSENNKITYEHTKDPVDVVTNDIVTYTIRVFNEGMKDGYAAEISDDMPAGLEFLPDNETNKEYRWVMYDKDGNKTEDVSKAVKIRTDYLSKEQGEAKMKEDTSLTENPYLLKAFDGSKEISEENPDNADVKVAFKVVEPNTSDKIIVNSAQISKDTDKNEKDIDHKFRRNSLSYR